MAKRFRRKKNSKVRTIQTAVSAVVLKRLRDGPSVDYVAAVVPFRARTDRDNGELPASEAAVAQNREYWNQVTELVETYRELVAEFGEQSGWWIHQFHEQQTALTPQILTS